MYNRVEMDPNKKHPFPGDAFEGASLTYPTLKFGERG